MYMSVKVLLLFYVLIREASFAVSQNCLAKELEPDMVVCVCNETYCDVLEPVKQLPPTQYAVYTSNIAGERFSKTIASFTRPMIYTNCTVPDSDKICEHNVHADYILCSQKQKKNLHESIDAKKVEKKIYINPKARFQEIFGFGGAFTDSTGINIKNMSPELQEYIMRSYFSDEGLEYNLGRVPMGGTDFSNHYYSYIDSDEEDLNCIDPQLRQMQLAPEDFEYKIPLIQEAIKLAKDLKLITSTWTIPKAFKENNLYRGSMGFVIDDLYQLLADYYVKFLDLYLKYGISFWGISTGNKPFLAMAEFAGIPAIFWFPDDLGLWIRENLGPTIRKSAFKNIKILTLDDQRPLLEILPKVLANPKTLDYIDGIALQFYFDFANNTYLLEKTHKQYPNKFMLSVEAAVGTKYTGAAKMGDWTNAELYATDIIQDFNHWVTGWIDWNMVLDTKGGPTLSDPLISPVTSNITEFYKEPQYYALAHFSKFITRGSFRIYSSQCDADNLVQQSAFQRPDGGIVVVILNRNDFPVKRTLINCGKSDIKLSLSARSITTVIYW
ncbi:putative glucosylceramidase 4 [Diabrotica undecimpunctata]|uniref:putative glucosylceramidase 4 n=1 Tax=Diabrotica undecimpunctata TaxID=50387 RepID=UPI003B63EAA5